MQKSTSSDVRHWFETPLGSYLIAREQDCIDQMVADIFGFHAMQLGLAQFDFLRMSRMPLRFAAGEGEGVKLRTDPLQFPIESQSLDLLVLPHVLEFSANPHQILREAERVLMPEGCLIVSGFNPWSLWGLWRLLRRTEHAFPWRGKFIGLPRLKDWLALLGFEVTGGRFCCYAPLLNREAWLRRFHFMEPAGDRWWAMGGAVYFLQARKRVSGMRLIVPNWNGQKSPEKALAPAAQKIGSEG